jgi:oleate hydratase
MSVQYHGTVSDRTKIHIVGGGIAGLSSAVFAVRDGHVPGKNIHIYEVLDVLGGAMDGAGSPDGFYVTRGDRKFNIEVFNCLWDVLSQIPSLTDPGKTAKEEIFEYNRTHKKNARSRLIDRDGNVDHVTTMGLDWGHRIRVLALIATPESRVENRRIDSWFAPSFFTTNLWKVFSSMFAIEQWNDLSEMRRYLRRFMHGIDLMVQGTAEAVTPYHNHDSIIVPITDWLGRQGVNFEMGCKVTDLDFNASRDELTVEKLYYTRDGKEEQIDIGEDEYVFVTNGSMTADSRRGSMSEAPALETGKLDGSWTLWENIAKKRPGLGNPSTFNSHIDLSKWPTFVVTSKDPTFVDLYEKFTGNKPGQADMVTFRDSSWHMSVLVPHHPHFIDQPEDVYIWGGCGLVPDEVGDYVKKKMSDCNGVELLTEVCHQFGFVEDLPHILETSTCIPQMMPYEMSHFLPRKKSDRPPVVPPGSTNLAFMGQFTESGECVMLVESSVRCGMIAAYTLLGVDREIPPLYSKVYSPAAWLKTFRTVLK